MKYEYLTNVSLNKAVEDYLKVLKENGLAPQKETINVTEALGRITYDALYAKISSPHYNASAMDGIAVMAKDTFRATETTPVVLTPEQYVVVDTGDPLPENCDAVVMIEDVIYEGENAKLIGAATPWQNVRQIGEDICSGDMLIPAYTQISPYSIGAMLAAGILQVDVIKKPIVGIIPTGDEIISPCDNPKPGDIIEFNSSIFSAMLKQWGCEPKVYGIVKDKKDLLTAALNTALSECDIVIVNAGSSAGRDDYTSTIIGEIGSVLYHGIAIKPGKPTILGYSGNKPIMGVPGYPVSGIVVLITMMKPVIEAILKIKLERNEYAQATLGKRINTSLKYEEFIRVQLGKTNEKLTAVPLSRGAGVVSSFVKADGLICIPQDSEGMDVGEKIQVEMLKNSEDIANTVVVTGSHDPLID